MNLITKRRLLPRLLLGGTLSAILLEVIDDRYLNHTSPILPPSAVYRRLAFKPPADIFEEVAPSVVFVHTYADMMNRYTHEIVNNTKYGSGSGFFWDDLGHIVTNYHVMENAKYATVTVSEPTSALTDGKEKSSKVSYEYNATLVGKDAGTDIAVLKIEPASYKIKSITKGDLKECRIGEPAYAIGNPFGLDHSMSAGIISGLARESRSPSGRLIKNLVQTDASINPGNSGGPLLDGNAKVIGMNFQGLTKSGTSSGVGFAIPIGTIKDIAALLIKDGKIIRAGLGISTLDSQYNAVMGISRGVLLMNVTEDSPLAKKNMKLTTKKELGDIIVKLDGVDINSSTDLNDEISKHEIGDEATLTVMRPDYNNILGGKITTKQVNITTTFIGVEQG